ncbi:hypothetical protein AOLI_G00299600 [Acnodon oligacanthus]
MPVVQVSPQHAVGGSGSPAGTNLHENQRTVRHARSDPTATTADIRRPGVTVWGAISYDASSSLVFITGTLTAQHYVLQLVVLPFLSPLSGALLQQDNARLHAAAISGARLEDTDTVP